MTTLEHRVKGVDHAAFPTFDPAGTVRFYRDVLGFPVVHSICAVGWGPEEHPDFIHFFFDIGNDDRIAFFYYFGTEPFNTTGRGDAYAGFGPEVPLFFIRSRHLAIHVDDYEDLMEYRRRLDASAWPVEMQIQHETIESIYTHDPNGYMIEITADGVITIDRRATGCRHAVWYSTVAGVPRDSRITQHDKNALRVEPA